MKIYATQSYSGTYGTITAGSTYTVTDANAQNLFRLGVAQPAEAQYMPLASNVIGGTGITSSVSGTLTIDTSKQFQYNGQIVPVTNGAIVVISAGLVPGFGLTLAIPPSATITIRSDGTAQFVVAGSAASTSDITRASTSNTLVAIQHNGTDNTYDVTGA